MGQNSLGKKYEIYKDDNGDRQQYQTDTGRIDILAISHDKKEFLVVELKKGRLKKERAADGVVGQTQRYMGYVIEKSVNPEQTVSGFIMALEDSKNLRRALPATQNINFCRYHVLFRLFLS